MSLRLKAYKGRPATLRVQLAGYQLLKDQSSVAAAQFIVATAVGEAASFVKTLADSEISVFKSNPLTIDIAIEAADTSSLSAYPHYCQLAVTPTGGSGLQIVDTGYIEILTVSEPAA